MVLVPPYCSKKSVSGQAASYLPQTPLPYLALPLLSSPLADPERPTELPSFRTYFNARRCLSKTVANRLGMRAFPLETQRPRLFVLWEIA